MTEFEREFRRRVNRFKQKFLEMLIRKKMISYIIRKTYDFLNWLKLPKWMQDQITFYVYVILPVTILIGTTINLIKEDIKKELHEEMIIKIEEILRPYVE